MGKWRVKRAIESEREEGEKKDVLSVREQHKKNAFQVFLLIFTLLSWLKLSLFDRYSALHCSAGESHSKFSHLYLLNIQRKFIFCKCTYTVCFCFCQYCLFIPII